MRHNERKAARESLKQRERGKENILPDPRESAKISINYFLQHGTKSTNDGLKDLTHISFTAHSFLKLFDAVDSENIVRLLLPDMFKNRSMKDAENEPKKHNSSARRVKVLTDPSSSTANKMPPSGAPNAVDTPVAAPTNDHSYWGISKIEANNPVFSGFSVPKFL